MRFGEFVDGLVDLVLPATCAGCDQPAPRPLCVRCRAALAGVRPGRTRPDPEPAGLPPTFALAAYAGAVRRAIVQYKEENRHELAGPLGGLLARVVTAAAAGRPVVLVPVPGTAASVRRRHGDHMLRLARAAVRALPGASIARPLRALPRDDDSAELSAAERARAAQEAFAVRRGVAAALGARVADGGAVVVLVDDIVTTGVTLAAAARGLAAAGVRVDRTAVIAATQRRAGRPGRAGGAVAPGVRPRSPSTSHPPLPGPRRRP